MTASTPTIQVIERMFALIDVLASREEPISLKEISEKTGLHPSTTHRILNDLTLGRFVDRPEAGSYRLGMRLASCKHHRQPAAIRLCEQRRTARTCPRSIAIPDFARQPEQPHDAN